MQTGAESPSILVVDDDPDTCELIALSLRRRGYDVTPLPSAHACLEMLRTRAVDVVITDVQMPGMSGIELCEVMRDRHPDVTPIVVTGLSTLDTAVGAIRAGAYDFVSKPVSMDVLEVALRRALERQSMKREVRRLSGVGDTRSIEGIVGESVALGRMTDMVRRVASSDASVLITGESGTGKELVARALHQLSPRKDQPFLAINCGAVPPHLLESELFGHVRGAFTDAKTTRAGLFVQAGAGTVLLDEIGEMPLEMQVKLLRVLQERTVRPVGSDEELPFEARIVTATNRDLQTEVEERRFREDLFYRINVVTIEVPSLRDRAGDIMLIARHVLDRLGARANKPPLELNQAAMRKLVDYSWPGNIRELENCLERCAAISTGQQLDVTDLPAKVRDHVPSRMELLTDDPEQMPSLEMMERRYVVKVLAAVGGNKTHAARVLGIDRRSLYRRLAPADISDLPS